MSSPLLRQINGEIIQLESALGSIQKRIVFLRSLVVDLMIEENKEPRAAAHARAEEGK